MFFPWKKRAHRLVHHGEHLYVHSAKICSSTRKMDFNIKRCWISCRVRGTTVPLTDNCENHGDRVPVKAPHCKYRRWEWWLNAFGYEISNQRLYSTENWVGCLDNKLQMELEHRSPRKNPTQWQRGESYSITCLLPDSPFLFFLSIRAS